MANNVEEFDVVIKGDSQDASSALVGLINQLQSLQSNITKLERQTKNYSKEFAGGSKAINDVLDYTVPKINEINKLLKDGKTGLSDIKGYISETNNDLRIQENLISVINKQLKEQKAIEEGGLKTQREFISLQNARARINSIDVTTAKDKLSALQMQKRELEDNIRLARQFGDSENSVMKLYNELALVRKKIASEKLAIDAKNTKELEAQARIEQTNAEKRAKSDLEHKIASAQSLVLQNAEAQLLSTTVGKMQIKAQQMQAELGILLKQEQSEANLLRIESLRNRIAEQGTLISAQRAKEQEKETQYDSVLSMHSAKRAIGYSVLFGAIGAVTAGLGALISNTIEEDMQMRTLAAVLKINVDQARGLSESIRDLGTTYGGSLKEIEGVSLALARAGVAQKDMVKSTEIVLRMARLTGDTFEQSASAVISFQQVFGDTTSIETLGNKLAYIANMSRLSTQDIGTFANYALAAAKTVGLTEDAIGGLATAFSNAGVNASTIGTQIRTFTGILTENSKDVTNFFQGIGVNQQALAREVSKGGEASNKAIMDFVETLSQVDKSTFNNLTGNMDKLTGNVLSLMRNNKDNILKFTQDLQAGADGQLQAVDVILEAHRVRFEKFFNWALNSTQNFITDLEKGLSTGRLLSEISALDSILNNPVKRSWKSPDELKAIEKELEVKRGIYNLSTLEFNLSENQKKLDKASGEDWQKLYEERILLLKGIANTRQSISGESMKTDKEFQAQHIKDVETRLALLQTEKKAFEDNKNTENTGYKTSVNEIKALEEELKKLKKTTQEVADVKVVGSSYTELGKNIKSKYAAEEIASLQEIETYNNALAKAKDDVAKKQEALFKVESRNNKEVIDQVKTIMADENGFALLTATAIQAEQTIQDLKSGTLQLSKKDTDEQILANEAFINAYNKVSELEDKKNGIIRESREVAEAQAKAAKATSDAQFKLQLEESKQGVLKKGGKGSALSKAEYEAMRNRDVSSFSEKDQLDWKVETSKKLTEYEKDLNTEKEKGLRADKSASKELYKQLEIAKERASLELEINQYAEGKYNTALGQLEVASQEYDFAVKNVEVAKAAKAEQLEIEKLQRGQQKAELEKLKASDAVTKQALEQKQAWEDIGLAWLQFMDSDTSPITESLVQAQQKARQLQEQIDAGGMNSIDLEKKKQDLLNAQLDIKQKQLAVEIESIELKANKELRALEAQAAQYERMSIIRESMVSTDNVQINNALKLADTLNNTAIRDNALRQERIKLDEQHDKDIKDTSKNQAEVNAKYLQDDILLKEKARTSEIAGYGQIAGAIGAMFQQGSKEAEAFQRIQAGLAMVNAVNAVLMAGATMPTPANFASMAAMAGMVATVLANAKIAFGGIGGTKTTTTSDAFSAQTANTGTSTVLGDATKQSESIIKAMETLKDFAKPQYQTLLSMNNYLKNISDNIGGVSSLLIQQGGFAFGKGFNNTDSGFKNNISSFGLDKINLFDKLTGTKLMGGILNSVMGGLFGKSSVSQSITDSGIAFADTLLSSAIKEFNGQAYQTISTTVSTKSWFSKSSSTSVASYFDALDNETERQFTLVLSNLYNTVLTAGTALDVAQAQTASVLQNFVVSIGKISLKDKTGEQIQETLTNIFGSISDNIAKTAFPLMAEFQKVGEGLFSTLTRVATGMQEADFYTHKLGINFQETIYSLIGNKQGDVGFEALLQSITKVETATYGANNNLLEIVSNLDATASELYTMYSTLDNLRSTLQFLNLSIEAISTASIMGAGSIDELSTGIQDYIENFKTDAEQLSYKTMLVQKSFNALGIAMPSSKEAFTKLIEGLDLSSESGQELYGRLIILSKTFAEVADGVTQSITDLQTTLDDLIQNGFDAFNTSMSNIFASILSMADATQNAIKGISSKSNATDFAKMVELSKNYTAFNSAKLVGDTATMSTIWEDILASASDIGSNSKYADSMTKFLEENLKYFQKQEDVIRVNIVDGLGTLLGLNNEQLTQLQSVASDGKITTTELGNITSLSTEQWKLLSSGVKVTDSQIQDLTGISQSQKDELVKANTDGKLTNDELIKITGLTQTQKDGILEVATNSNYFSTEGTLSDLATYSKLQLDAYQQSLANESVGLTKQTLSFGDYIGTQEKIDISKLLGVSYDTAAPLVQKIQQASALSDPTEAIKSIIGYTSGATSYDTSTASQLKLLAPYTSMDIASVIGSVDKEVAATNLRNQQFEAAKNDFYNRYASANNNLNTQASESRSAWTNVLAHIHDEDKAYFPEDNIASALPSNPNQEYYKYGSYEGRWQDYVQQHSEAYNAYAYLQALAQEKALKGYATGGYTGDGGKYEPAGIVHRGEYIVNSQTTKDLGLNQGQGGVFKEMLDEMKEMKTENKYMRQLLAKLTADNSRMLSLDRASYSLAVSTQV